MATRKKQKRTRTPEDRARGSRTRAARIAAQLKQVELASLVGVHAATVCHWEAGRIVPTTANMRSIAYATGADFASLASD